MKVSILLADTGTSNPHTGTLSLLNVGWTVTPGLPAGAPPGLGGAPQAVAVFLEAELSECNRPTSVALELVSEDSDDPVELPGPAGPQPMQITSQMVIASPPGVPTGFPGRANFLVNLAGGLPLAPGVYKWRVKVNGESRPDWSAQFFVAPPPAMPTFGLQPPMTP